MLLIRDSGELSFPVNRSEGMTSFFQFLFAASVQAPSGPREEQTGAPILLLALCCACPTRAVQVLPPFHARNLVRLGVETHQELTNDFCAALRKRRGTDLRTRVVTISDDENSRHMVFATAQCKLFLLLAVRLRPFGVNSKGCLRKVGCCNASELDCVPLLGVLT